MKNIWVKQQHLSIWSAVNLNVWSGPPVCNILLVKSFQIVLSENISKLFFRSWMFIYRMFFLLLKILFLTTLSQISFLGLISDPNTVIKKLVNLHWTAAASNNLEKNFVLPPNFCFIYWWGGFVDSARSSVLLNKNLALQIARFMFN